MTRLTRRCLGAVTLGLCATLGVSLTAATPAAAAAVDVASPAGEIVVVTVNALQRELDTARLDELAKALSTRADGANGGTVYAPDVIVIQEITQSVLVSLRDKLNGLMNARYATAGHTSNAGFDGDMKVKLLLNTSTMEPATPKTWIDVCDSTRIYQLITTRETATSKPVAVAGVHFAPMDNPAGSDDCKTRNSAELRKQLAPYDEYGSVVGDFNRRAMQLEYECDPEEKLSGPMSWYSAITAAPAGGHAYLDAVREYHRRFNFSMAQQWTFEKEAPELMCTGTSGIRRMRLDYIFVSDVLFPIEASVDDPGWAGVSPGTVGCSVAPACKYSDHRFVAARLRLPGSQPAPVDTVPPAAPAGLAVSAATAGQLSLTWTRNGESDVAGYRVERSTDGQTWSLRTPALLTEPAYADTAVTPGVLYSYRVLAVDTSDNVSLPSGVVSETAPAVTVYVDAVATGETTTAGTRSGSYVDTHTTGGGSEVLKEVESGGKTSRRYSLLDHRWTVPVTGASKVTFFVQASATTSSDGDTFQFMYSVDGGTTYSSLVTVASGASGTFSASLPGGTKGQVLVRVTDTNRSAGNRALDSISVDHLYIRSG